MGLLLFGLSFLLIIFQFSPFLNFFKVTLYELAPMVFSYNRGKETFSKIALKGEILNQSVVLKKLLIFFHGNMNANLSQRRDCHRDQSNYSHIYKINFLVTPVFRGCWQNTIYILTLCYRHPAIWKFNCISSWTFGELLSECFNLAVEIWRFE